MADIMDRIGQLAEEVGSLTGQGKARLLAFGLGAGQTVMTVEEATGKFQAGLMAADLFGQLAGA